MSRATLSLIGLYNANSTLFNGFRVPDGMDKDVAVNNILLECAELETLYADPEFMQFAIETWTDKEFSTWERVYKAETLEYNPIENYDRNEEIIEGRSGNRSASTSANGRQQAFSNGTTKADATHTVAGFNSDSLVNASGDGSTETNSNVDSANTATEAESTEQSNDVFQHSNHTHGNIGVTTSQQMLEAEIDVAAKANTYNYIVHSFRNRFCLLIY